jgi:Concanavalin A-like lectin/glucanases superfamily
MSRLGRLTGLWTIVMLVGAALLALPGVGQAQPFGVWMNFSPGYPTSSGWIQIPHSPALNPTGAFTFEAWVAITNNAGSEDCRSIAGKNYTQAWWIGLCTVGGQPTLRSYLKGSGSLKNGGRITRNEWTHVAVVFNGTQRLHYINGELAATFAETGPLTTSTDPMRIGSDTQWLHSPTGSIDEVRLWNVARTIEQIRANINVAITTPQPGLVGVWSPGPTATVGSHNGVTQGTGIFPFTFPAAISCGSSTATSLCLQDHFSVRAKWRTSSTPGITDGDAHTVPVVNPGSGLFWFFSPDNWEVMVKVINGCGLNNRFWVFSAATTNVFYRLEVVDVRAGAQKIYFNYPGPPAPAVTDTSAFATCP